MGAALPRVLLACLAWTAVPALAASDRGGATGAAGDLLRGSPAPAGDYDAQMCVTVGAEATHCGPVSADIGPAGQALLRISDIAYRLELYGDRLGVSLFHGTMQIDGFFAPYRWSGLQLQFIDTEKATRYELKLGPRRFDLP